MTSDSSNAAVRSWMSNVLVERDPTLSTRPRGWVEPCTVYLCRWARGEAGGG